MSQMVEIKVPDIGGHADVDVIDVAVKAGDVIAVDDTLITLETDKATMDVPAEVAGVVKEIKIQVGDKVAEGSLIALIESAAEAAVPTAAKPAPAAVADTAFAAGSTRRIAVPDIGGHENVDVIAVEVKPGDVIAVDDTLITLETDKATMDVPATAAGTVTAVHITVGDKVSEGSLIVDMALDGESPAVSGPGAVAVAAEPVAVQKQSAPLHAAFGATPIDERRFAQAHAGPSTRKLARELGVDLGLVRGSGRKGRISGTDVKAFVKNALQAKKTATEVGTALGGGLDLLPWPQVDFAKFGEIEVKARARIQKISGQNLARNWAMIPHVTHHNDADMTDLEAFRQQINQEWARDGIKMSPLAFIIKAAAKALRQFPEFNASLDGENLILKKYCHIGFAADTPNGLVVPVIRDADQKGLKHISMELAELSQKARDGKLKPQQMQGACFTVSSLGGIGGTGFTPIVNAPEVAILGVCKAQIKPVWGGTEFTPRLMCPLSLSFDHRVIDGAGAMRFLVYLSDLLADFRRVTV